MNIANIQLIPLDHVTFVADYIYIPFHKVNLGAGTKNVECCHQFSSNNSKVHEMTSNFDCLCLYLCAYRLYTPFHEDTGGAGTKAWNAVVNAIILVSIVLVMTVFLVILFKYRCYKVSHIYFSINTLDLQQHSATESFTRTHFKCCDRQANVTELSFAVVNQVCICIFVWNIALHLYVFVLNIEHSCWNLKTDILYFQYSVEIKIVSVLGTFGPVK